MFKNTRPELSIRMVMIFLSGACFSETEEGESTTAASCGRKDVVNMKKVKRSENRSTIGVMSMCGFLTGAFILGIEF
jgi:hypothetical protein